MPKRKPWYEALFVRDFYDYFYVGGPRGALTEEQAAQQADMQVEFIARALELPGGARILDLGCGWGRHSVRLAQRGYRVTGLDLSAYHLRLATAAARQAAVQVEWVRADMREIPRGRRFDAVISCFSSFGYFDDENEDQRVLSGVARSLRPGGRFFLDTMNAPMLLRNFRETDSSDHADGGLVVERRRYDIHRGRIDVDLLYVGPDGKRRTGFHSVRLYAFTELAALLSKAGLRVARGFGNWDGSELSMNGPRMIVVVEKA